MTDTPDAAPDPVDPILAEIMTKVAANYPDTTVNFTDVADVHPSILAGYKAAIDVRVYNGTSRVERSGKIALTRGPRPAFVLVEPQWKGGTHLLGHNDVVIAHRTGGKGAPNGGWVRIAKIEQRNGVRR
ncbi:hypothetical protein I5G59_gp80 [Mycobacterium phage LilMcDreamy]|uniref:Uncharacterized protein n=1 Tax=Mycobacterium phage LilMcDreamy TaxID=2652422 RepID=A0A5P8D9D2_9CAUD|nr:hypothetical protein I5G59_gp80 [Mycobacterium phage LilMcDreamy]QFP94700.1 hypothetical protein SEA_LILMCDREAMY_80 [Mycobacterium phage LilMcDreamy]